MFSSGELILIGLVALIVIGPERLPKVARAAGIMLGRMQRYVNDVKADIDREMQLGELKKMQSDVVSQVRDMEQSVNARLQTVESELNESIAAGIEGKAAAAAAEPAAAVLPAGTASAEPATTASSSAAAEATTPPVTAAAPSEKPQA
jgi:sec-independent protein translocase protein TatB